MLPATVSKFPEIRDVERLLHLVNSRPARSRTASTGAITLRIVFVERTGEAAQYYRICIATRFHLPSFLWMLIIVNFQPRMDTGTPLRACRERRAVEVSGRIPNRRWV